MYMFPQPFGSRNFGSFASIVLSSSLILEFAHCHRTATWRGTRSLERHATKTRSDAIQPVLFSWVLTLVMFK